MTDMLKRLSWGARTPGVRIAFGLVCLTISLILTGDALLGLTEDPTTSIYTYRRALCETLAVQYSTLAARGAEDAVRAAMQELVARSPEVASAALRSAKGAVVAEAGDHRAHWVKPTGDRSTLDYAQVPILSGAERWGTLEVAFVQSQARGLAGLWANSLVRLLVVIGTAGFVLYLLFMRRTLRHLDPMAVVPERVKATLDVLAEGVVLLDSNERIVLANAAFVERMNRPIASLLGRKVSELSWTRAESPETPPDYPWTQTQHDGNPRKGALLEGLVGEGETRKFVVNSAPIVDGGGTVRGVVATFDDVTALEKTNAHLRDLTRDLEASQQEVTRQNHELRHLAARDPLTGCFNRRAFFEGVDAAWAQSRDEGQVVGCIMTDIDRFKSFNDKYGHAIGDQIIQVVARTLGSALRITDVLGRYGGEEFCIILPGLDAAATADVAERLRRAIEAEGGAGVRTAGGLRITASFGTASRPAGSTINPTTLIDQADQALLVAKQTGRNRVVLWEDLATVKPDSLLESPSMTGVAG